MFRLFRQPKTIDELNFERIKPSSKLLVDVPTNQTISHLTCFTPESNPFSTALKAYEQSGIESLRSNLMRYYRNNAYETVADIWALKSSRLSALPAMSVVMPWAKEDHEKKLERIAMKTNSGQYLSREAASLGLDPAYDYGWQFFGPASPSLIDLECNRLVSVYESVKKQGYKPVKNGHMHGYVLANSQGSKLVVVGGKHRYAALIALGFETIPVIIKSKVTPLCVNRDKMEDWPHVNDGTYKCSEALKIFDRQFYGIAL